MRFICLKNIDAGAFFVIKFHTRVNPFSTNVPLTDKPGIGCWFYFGLMRLIKNGLISPANLEKSLA